MKRGSIVLKSAGNPDITIDVVDAGEECWRILETMENLDTVVVKVDQYRDKVTLREREFKVGT